MAATTIHTRIAKLQIISNTSAGWQPVSKQGSHGERSEYGCCGGACFQARIIDCVKLFDIHLRFDGGSWLEGASANGHKRCGDFAGRRNLLSPGEEAGEEGQFKADDLNFITTWIDRNISPLGPKIASSLALLPVVASKNEYMGSETAKIESDSVNETATAKNEIAVLPQQVPEHEFKNRIATTPRPQINFWIELFRNGKIYRCNNKTEFKSGDQIRFHLIPGSDGYAYLVMKAGTTGKSYFLFPTAEYGTRNYLTKGQDYTIPSKSWMKFDEHPGTEQLGLVFANQTVAVTPQSFQDNTETAFVSEERSGAKDLCPTRMKLTWDDPTPVMIPDDFSGVSQLQNSGDSSLVRLMSGAGGKVSASIQLLHGN